MGKALPGLLVAACLALILADASIFGIATWKIVLAVVGLVLFVITGKRSGT